MFTVVICSKSFVRSIRQNCAYILELIAQNPACGICLWDPEADSFEDALPDLKNVIAGKPKWRAIVVQDAETFGREKINQRNPFDAVGSVGALPDFGERRILSDLDDIVAATDEASVAAAVAGALGEPIAESARRIREYRERKQRNYAGAVKSPLTRLGLWLCGLPANAQPEYPITWPAELQEDTVPVDGAYYCTLHRCRLLASEIEQYHSMSYRYRAMSAAFDEGAQVERKPEMVLVISERNARCADEVFKTSSEHHEELEYSNFCDDNLYGDRMRFVFFDVNYENNIRSTADYLSFASLVSVYAESEIPEGAIRPGYVYKSTAVMNKRAVKALFDRYLAKLKRTRQVLANLFRRQEQNRAKKDLSREDAIELFESDERIPVVIRQAPDRNEFMAEHKKLGLAKDCPRDEYHYWYDQVTEITKKFIRFLREPRRAVKTAVKSDLRARSVIDDERIWNLDEFQREDIQFRLAEEEQQMVESTAANLFNTAEFTRRIDKADREVRKKIGQRMTRKKTVIVGLIALAAYLFGFLSLIFENTFSVDTFLCALLVIGISLGVIALCAFVYLLVMKKRLKDRVLHFNKEMSGMLMGIDFSLKDFSRYLSHACNVMREFSIFNCFEKNEDKKLNTIRKHICDIDGKIHQIGELILSYNVEEPEFAEDVEPYYYDFTLMRNYTYEMPYTQTVTSIEFLMKGNEVIVPIDYIEKITIEREEIYD